MIHAILSNPSAPEYGQATIPFPIPTEEYDHVLEVLAPFGIGDALQRDCRVDELAGEYPVLRCLEGQNINLDELDFLAKRLDSFDAGETAQFQAMAVKLGISDVTDLINLSFCCQQATVITDFSELEAVGRHHYMNINGGCARKEELEDLDGIETALLLIEGGGGTVTPYGVVYDNGMKLEQVYNGRQFPCYHYDREELTVGINPRNASDMNDLTWLYLPAPQKQIERLMERGGIHGYDDARVVEIESSLPDQVGSALRLDREGILELNELCQTIAPMDNAARLKLEAAVLMAEPEYAYQVKHLAENLDQFQFIPGAKTPENYGRYMIQKSGRFEFDDNLDAYYDYTRYAEDRMRHESGQFNELGYISYHGTMSLDELMMEDPTEQHQREQGFQMGGMA